MGEPARNCPKCERPMVAGPCGFLKSGARRMKFRCAPCDAPRIRAAMRGPKKTAFNRAYQNRYPEKRAAHKLVERALLKGALVKSPCAICAKPQVEAHHEDYSRPLDVTWLCRFHHLQRHREIDDLVRDGAEQFAGAAE